jgi:hypothetical protein
MGEMRHAYKIFVRNLKGREHLGNLGIDGNNEMDLKESVCALDSSCSGQDPVAVLVHIVMKQGRWEIS